MHGLHVYLQSRGCQKNDLLGWSPELVAGMLIHARIPIPLSVEPPLTCISNWCQYQFQPRYQCHSQYQHHCQHRCQNRYHCQTSIPSSISISVNIKSNINISINISTNTNSDTLMICFARQHTVCTQTLSKYGVEELL